MSITLTIRDQSLSSQEADHVFEMRVSSESMTVRELIRERVYQEVDDYNRQVRSATDGSRYRGLVRPEPVEERLNGPRESKVRTIDWKRSFDRAVEAFERRQLIVLAGSRQCESLDERIDILPDTEVCFLRLVMLVGG